MTAPPHTTADSTADQDVDLFRARRTTVVFQMDARSVESNSARTPSVSGPEEGKGQVDHNAHDEQRRYSSSRRRSSIWTTLEMGAGQRRRSRAISAVSRRSRLPTLVFPIDGPSLVHDLDVVNPPPPPTLLADTEKRSISSSASSESSGITTSWPSIYLLAVVSMFCGVQFSIFFASLWPFLNTVDPTASASFFGFITASFSLGQAISSPLFGFWMNYSGTVKFPIAAGIAMMTLSNLIFCLVESFQETKRRYVMLVARFFIGFGSGIVGVIRAYSATASTLADRTKAITYIQASYVVGMIFGPGLAAAFTPLGDGFHIGSLHIDMYTSPAWFASVFNLSCLILLFIMLKEVYAGIMNMNSKSTLDEFDEQHWTSVIPDYDLVPVMVCVATQFTMMFLITNLETIGSIFSIAMWDWTNAYTVKVTGIAQAGGGGISLIVYLLIAYKIGNYLAAGRERIVVIIGLIIGVLFHLVTFSWPFLPDHLNYRPANIHDNSTWVGCDQSKYSWCSHTKKVYYPVYITANTLTLSVAFPFMNVCLNTLFSKVLGPRQQGTMQGILLMAGSLARTAGPLMVSFLFQHYGPEVTWAMEVVVLVPTILLWVIFYRRLVPLELTPSLKSGDHFKYEGGVKYRF